MRIAVEGCCHGQFEEIYATLQALERRHGFRTDLLLVCGDAQAMRNEGDVETMACPPKYRHIGNFYKYYKGELVAPVLTIVIGGNHEASNHLHELFHGGWLAPNIYYLGCTGVVRFGGLRIAGMSGIYDRKHFHECHFERSPYTDAEQRSIYHVREFGMLKLRQLTGGVDIMLSHDWPGGIAHYGDLATLLRRKPYFEPDIRANELGNPAAPELMTALRPSYWFAAHMHVKFAALVPHSAEANGPTTQFLALDKCLFNRDFMQVVEVDARGPLRLEYDPEWLAIVALTWHVAESGRPAAAFPARMNVAGKVDELKSKRKEMSADDDEDLWVVPENFEVVATPHDPAKAMNHEQIAYFSNAVENPQTVTLCQWLGIPTPQLQKKHNS